VRRISSSHRPDRASRCSEIFDDSFALEASTPGSGFVGARLGSSQPASRLPSELILAATDEARLSNPRGEVTNVSSTAAPLLGPLHGNATVIPRLLECR